jgi:hypothetical protein
MTRTVPPFRFEGSGWRMSTSETRGPDRDERSSVESRRRAEVSVGRVSPGKQLQMCNDFEIDFTSAETFLRAMTSVRALQGCLSQNPVAGIRVARLETTKILCRPRLVVTRRLLRRPTSSVAMRYASRVTRARKFVEALSVFVLAALPLSTTTTSSLTLTTWLIRFPLSSLCSVRALCSRRCAYANGLDISFPSSISRILTRLHTRVALQSLSTQWET